MRKLAGGGALGAIALLGAGWLLDARRRHERLRDTYRILVDLLLNALTADDPLTARHSRRVADLSYALGQACHLPARSLTTLRIAALLHDLGKIDDRLWGIVHSPDSLTPRQREKMEVHPDQSARILGPLEALVPGVTAIVAAHHERWDGQGYPDGLAGEAIPLEGRIISVADVFDAVTQPRRYHEPVTAAQGLKQIQEGAGTQFDPRVVECLMASPAARRAWVRIVRAGRREEQAGHKHKHMVTRSKSGEHPRTVRK